MDLPGIEKCCDKHDYCYDTCNSARETCDKSFKTCLHDVCKHLKKNPKISQKGWCTKHFHIGNRNLLI